MFLKTGKETFPPSGDSVSEIIEHSESGDDSHPFEAVPGFSRHPAYGLYEPGGLRLVDRPSSTVRSVSC